MHIQKLFVLIHIQIIISVSNCEQKVQTKNSLKYECFLLFQPTCHDVFTTLVILSFHNWVLYKVIFNITTKFEF